MKHLKIKKLDENAVVPTRATPGSAGLDLCACTRTPIVIPAGGRAMVPTGLAIAIGDMGAVGLIFGRSGLGSKFGVAPSNCVGVIDSDYRGEIIIPLANHGEADFTVRHGERVAQLLIVPIFTPEPLLCDEIDKTARGTGGFGSSG
ncbi:MAG: dUTP diphosphatase [Oscillospiraceae bacterium]|nr:dUTP diphosphatase [Oscillospiraceae bacterium]